MRILGWWLSTCALFEVVSAAIGTGPHWPGFKGLQYMFIFGDSYSTVSWSPFTAPVPSPANPIGVQWPGLTSVGSLQPNWVGYMTNGFNVSNLLAFDYAIAGNNITGFTSQIQTEFVPTAGQKPAGIPWTADNSVFISWIGINDLAENVAVDVTINQIMLQQQSLYALGARNFIFINVPPWDRAPLGATVSGLAARILGWNAQLATSALAFSVQNTDTSTLVFSSWDTFNSILNNPGQYNLSNPTAIGGDIWKDDLHPTSAIHYRIANDLAGWLNSLPAGPSTPTTTTTTSAAPSTTTTVPSPSPSGLLTLTTPNPDAAASVVPSVPSSTPRPSSGSARWNRSWAHFGLALLGILATQVGSW